MSAKVPPPPPPAPAPAPPPEPVAKKVRESEAVKRKKKSSFKSLRIASPAQSQQPSGDSPGVNVMY